MRDEELKIEEVKDSHTRWNGGMGYQRRGKWTRKRREVCVGEG